MEKVFVAIVLMMSQLSLAADKPSDIDINLPVGASFAAVVTYMVSSMETSDKSVRARLARALNNGNQGYGAGDTSYVANSHVEITNLETGKTKTIKVKSLKEADELIDQIIEMRKTKTGEVKRIIPRYTRGGRIAALVIGVTGAGMFAAKAGAFDSLAVDREAAESIQYEDIDIAEVAE